ncbi:MAG: 50S ribosomal protein L20, partial [Armatimonadetes bacterium]|nr:50S ribosomal protein L20 [Armatimonadota bacterium]
AYRDRRANKRNFRRLWITRISAACRSNGGTYARFIEGLTKGGFQIDRKVLSDIAINNPVAFKDIMSRAAEALKVERPAIA